MSVYPVIKCDVEGCTVTAVAGESEMALGEYSPPGKRPEGFADCQYRAPDGWLVAGTVDEPTHQCPAHAEGAA